MLLELLWFAYSYARSGMTEKTFLVPELEAGHSGESVSETEGEIYGIGIEKGAEICSGFTKKSIRRPETELFLDFPYGMYYNFY